MEKKLLCMFVIFLGLKSIGQTPGMFLNMPKIMTPSPEASAVYKVSDLSVDYSTGTSNISVPIYNIQEGKINVPVSVSYNTGGIKVQDVSGMVGIGWNFNWGGVITVKQEASGSGQTVSNAEYKQESDMTSPQFGNKLTFTNALLAGTQEKQTPEYFYQFGSYSGSFFYDINNRLSIKSNQQNLLIQKIINGFIITTPDGIKYTFTNQESTTGNNGYAKVTAFFISNIVDPSSDRFVYFKYKAKPNYLITQESQSISYTLYRSTGDICQLPSSIQAITTPSNVISVQIDSVVYNSGFIKIKAINDRQDIDPVRITGLDVYNYKSEKIKNVQFYQSYFISTGAPSTKHNRRLKLDSVSFKSTTTDEEIEKYRFSYNEAFTPAYKKSNGLNQTGIDYWGFFNGKEGNAGIIPRDVINTADLTTNIVPTDYLGDRKADSNYAQAFVLNKIKYPTGGVVQLIYESNIIPGSILGDVVGGLRVKKIIYFDGVSSMPRTKYFKYINGSLPVFFTKNLYTYDKIKTSICSGGNCNQTYCAIDYTLRYVTSDPTGSLAYLLINPFYSEVEEYDVVNGHPEQKIKYYFDTINQYWVQAIPAIEFGGIYVTERSWLKHDLLKKTEYYKISEAGVYSLSKKEENTYNDLFETNPQIGMHIAIKPYYDYVGGDYATIHPEANGTPASLYPYYYINARNSHGSRVLSKKRVVEYNSLDSLVITSNFFYKPYNLDAYNTNNYFFQLNQISQVSSKKDTLNTYFKYALDSKTAFSNLDGAASEGLDSLKARNMISNVLQQEKFNNSSLLSIDRMTYNIWIKNGKKFILPKAVYSQVYQNPMEQRVLFSAYDDAGNISEQLQSNGVKNSYLWDYRKTYPIAKIINASLLEVGYSNFEAEENGGWNVPSLLRSINLFNGSKCYNLNNGSLTRPSIVIGKPYILSYWSQNGMYNVTGLSNPTIKQTSLAEGWILYQYQAISSLTTVSVSGTGLIDEIKLLPQDAQSSTMTYKVLVGKTSETGASEMTNYYSYDDMNRLKFIKDYVGNIKSNITYNYTSNTSFPQYNYSNISVNRSFTKNSSLCGTGFTGSTVVYEIPAGTFYAATQSAANTLALDEITNNGQDYANTHGACMPVKPVINTLTSLTKRSFLIDFVPITNCTSIIIHYTDVSNGQVGSTIDVPGDCNTSKTISIDPNAFGTFRVTVTCFSSLVPAGVTSDSKDIYLPY